MANYSPLDIETYIFGGGDGTAGIASITGDAGGEINDNLTFGDFVETVLAYLYNEHEDMDPDALREEFADESVRREMYGRFKTACAERAAEEQRWADLDGE